MEAKLNAEVAAKGQAAQCSLLSTGRDGDALMTWMVSFIIIVGETLANDKR